VPKLLLDSMAPEFFRYVKCLPDGISDLAFDWPLLFHA
jgi:hypothetical protein